MSYSQGFSFDPTQYDPEAAGGGNQMPLGRHPVIIQSASKVFVKNSDTSAMWVATLYIIDGPNKGSTGTYRLNLWHEKEDTRAIAHNQMSALCYVTQTFGVENNPAFPSIWNKPFVVQVEPQTDPKYTQITAVFDIRGEAPKKANGPVRTAPPANQPPQGGPPAGYQQQGPQGGGQPPQGGAPTAPAGGPSWGGQPNQPQQQQPNQPPQGGPSWGGPQTGGGPMQGQPPQQQGYQQPQQPGQPAGQPSWQQQPPAGGPSWGR